VIHYPSPTALLIYFLLGSVALWFTWAPAWAFVLLFVLTSVVPWQERD
jgi:hypothetical protein